MEKFTRLLNEEKIKLSNYYKVSKDLKEKEI